ncbi:GerAB/ArcD/ProY family transporter [Clostridium felsineum]|uniref:GerAB/ArcD/ProY family transporter n=1 Tax=Clostridium felsineum TaxID=36839 RepID=UPI00098CDB0B|nr:GerAB/ArcD/ProY family transporter [Clostridium felsineum]URZ18701.1 hypothetical protein CLFE_047890 [Clostridium felsineum DSM 794]
MIQLSKREFFALMFIFEVGSTPLFELGIEAKEDAWIAILLSLLVGTVTIWIITELQSVFPTKNLVEIILIILGKKLGFILCTLYLMSYIWVCGRNLREFAELIIIQALPHASLWIILISFLALSVYTLSKGFEVLARTSQLVLPLIIFFLVSLIVLVSISHQFNLKNITPILANGFKPIIGTLPQLMWFPSGEIAVFLLYWHYMNDKKIVRKVTLEAVLLSGLLLCSSTILNIAVLGVNYTSSSTIPLLETIRVINIGGIITHLDVIGVIIIFIGGFFKMSVFLNSITVVISSLFNMKNSKMLLIPTGIFMLFFSIYFEPSFAYHQWMFPFDSRYFQVMYPCVFPPMLLLIYIIKKKRAEF